MKYLSQNPSYKYLLGELKEKIRKAQIKAMGSVNQGLLLLYWEIGKGILERQAEANWGDKMLTQLSKDLRAFFPSMKGFSLTNLKYMRQFAIAYPDFSIGQVPLDQLSLFFNSQKSMC